ncbi:PRK06851 family protein [Peribacillus butanolivorans]|uniref:PRK06851 family protein n=1 Tax=Peribacillus butanolivorans TaxID=421767 RepID=UPI003D283ED4
MAGKVMHYFAGGNTAKGFYSLYDSNLAGLEKLFILKGGPGSGKSTIMKKIGQEWLDKDYDIEFLHCSSDNDSIDGVIIPALKIGLVDGTAPHVIEPKAPGAIEEYVNLGAAWNTQQLAAERTTIIRFTNARSKSFEKAYALFAEALKIHDEWEDIYKANIDFVKLNGLTNKLIEGFYRDIVLNKKADVRHRFLGAATPEGAVDYIPSITKGVQKRYFLKGRPGSGKSTMLKKIAKAAEKRGFDVEVYHCGFDPESLDMVIVREAGIAIFDSTSPHEYFPSREGDEIIDIYKTAIHSGTDEIYADQIKDVSSRYRAKMNEATACLVKAKEHHDALEAIYVKAMDFTAIDDIQKDIQEQITARSKTVDSHTILH